MTRAQLESAAPLIDSAAVLLVQLEIRLEVVKAALDIGRRAGTTTVLNPAPALRLDDELLSMVDICIPNEVEAAALTQRSVGDKAGALEAARVLRRRGCKAVIVTLGSKGAVYLDHERALEVPSLRVPVVDTVAAGDAFCGAFASALARGEALEVASDESDWSGGAGRRREGSYAVVAIFSGSGPGDLQARAR